MDKAPFERKRSLGRGFHGEGCPNVGAALRAEANLATER